MNITIIANIAKWPGCTACVPRGCCSICVICSMALSQALALDMQIFSCAAGIMFGLARAEASKSATSSEAYSIIRALSRPMEAGKDTDVVEIDKAVDEIVQDRLDLIKPVIYAQVQARDHNAKNRLDPDVRFRRDAACHAAFNSGEKVSEIPLADLRNRARGGRKIVPQSASMDALVGTWEYELGNSYTISWRNGRMIFEEDGKEALLMQNGSCLQGPVLVKGECTGDIKISPLKYECGSYTISQFREIDSNQWGA